MTLIVDGNRQFRAATLRALQSICPCFIYELADNGEVLLQSSQNHDKFCKCYCVHLAGCNLMTDLTGSRNTVKIKRTTRGAKYKYRRKRRRVSWNPNATPNAGIGKGKKAATPPEIVLGHELIHAHHHNEGTLSKGRTNDIPNEEINTVRGENQLRAEHRPPLPERKTYGRRRVPSPGTPDLDTTDRYDCKCSERQEEPKKPSKIKQVTSEQQANILDGIAGPGRSGVAAQMASALDLRAAAIDATGMHTVLEEAFAAKQAIIFESISLADESHTFFVLSTDGETVQVIANALVEREDTLWTIDLLAGAKTLNEPLSRDGAGLLERLTSSDLNGTVGGDADTLDGTLDILTIAEGGDIRTAALYGSDWTQTDDNAEPPEDRADAATWEAMETARALIFGQMANN